MAEDVAAIEPTETEKLVEAADSQSTMAVKVYAPFQVYFEGRAHSVSAENAVGPFDILPKHRNFLCMLVPCNLTVKPIKGRTRVIKVHRALMHVKADKVTVFMDV